MSEAMFAAVVDALHDHYTPALLSEGAVIESITSLLRLANVEHPAEVAVLLACDSLVSTGTYAHSRPKELVLDVEKAHQALLEALRAQMLHRSADPKPAPNAPTPASWLVLGELLDSIRKLYAKMSTAASAGQRHSYLLVTTTPKQQERNQKGNSCPGPNEPSWDAARVGNFTGLQHFDASVMECVAKHGHRRAAGTLALSFIGPYWPAELAVMPGCNFPTVKLWSGGAGALGALLSFEAVGRPEQVSDYVTAQYRERFCENGCEFPVPFYRLVTAVPVGPEGSLVYSVDLGSGRVTDLMLAQFAAEAEKACRNASLHDADDGKAVLLFKAVQLDFGDSKSWAYFVASKEVGPHALTLRVEGKLCVAREVEPPMHDTHLWLFMEGVEGSAGQAEAIKQHLGRATGVAASMLSTAPHWLNKRSIIEGAMAFKCASEAFVNRVVDSRAVDTGLLKLSPEQCEAMWVAPQVGMALAKTSAQLRVVCEKHGVEFTLSEKGKKGKDGSGVSEAQVAAIQDKLASLERSQVQMEEARKLREEEVERKRVETEEHHKQELEMAEQLAASRHAETMEKMDTATRTSRLLLHGLLEALPNETKAKALQAAQGLGLSTRRALEELSADSFAARGSAEQMDLSAASGVRAGSGDSSPAVSEDGRSNRMFRRRGGSRLRVAPTAWLGLAMVALMAAVAEGSRSGVGGGREQGTAVCRGSASLSCDHPVQMRCVRVECRSVNCSLSEEAWAAATHPGAARHRMRTTEVQRGSMNICCDHREGSAERLRPEAELSRLGLMRRTLGWTRVRRMDRQRGKQFASWVRGRRRKGRNDPSTGWCGLLLCFWSRPGAGSMHGFAVSEGMDCTGSSPWHAGGGGGSDVHVRCSWGVVVGWWAILTTARWRRRRRQPVQLSGGSARSLWWGLLACLVASCEGANVEHETAFQFNTRGLAVSGAVATGLYFSALAQRKLAFIEGRLLELRPTVGVLLELGVGGARAVGFLQRWFLRRGYGMKALPAGQSEGRWKNGVAVIYRKDQMRPLTNDAGAVALAERVLRVSLRRVDGSILDVTAWHGHHGERGFAAQMVAMEEAHVERGAGSGGLVLADVNRRTCRKQASGSKPLAAGDAMWRSFCGVGCDCDGGGCGPAVDAEEARCELVDLPGVYEENYTRWAMVDGRPVWSQIDRAAAFGDERGKWQLQEVVWADDAAVPDGMLSDHAMVVWRREVDARAVASAEVRWLAPRTKLWSKADRDCFTAMAGGLIASIARGDITGAAALSEADAAVVMAAEQVEGDRTARKSNDNVEAVLGQWRWRLRVALELRANPGEVFRDGRLLHKRCGLRKFIIWARSANAEPAEVVARLVRRCRREETFLCRIVEMRRAKARRWVEKLQRSESISDPMERSKVAFAAMKEWGDSDKLWSVAIDDDPAKGFVDTSEEVRREAGCIGTQAQEEYVQGNPAPAGAFQAFAQHFMEQFEELRAPDGSRFELQKLLTFDLFKEQLYGYARHKAVGPKVRNAASSLELLRMLDEEVLREYFVWVKECATSRELPVHWREMVYTLLKKKHGDQRRVRKMREIALMDQTLKLMLRCVKRLSFDRLVGRTGEHNKGWIPGHGALDAAFIADCVLGQARELKHDIFILWLDLAQFFPSIKRVPRRFAEWMVGLPEDVALLARSVFEGMNARFNTAHGLSDRYEILGGDLMGCILSPDHARMVLTAVSVAVAAVSAGVKIWGCDAKARYVCQTMMADDWKGFNTTELSLREQWRVWVDYSLASGSPIGFAGLEKTVVAAGRYKAGKWVNVPVRLEIPQGEGGMQGAPKCVPQLSVRQVYPHMGILRAICGDRQPFMKKLLKGVGRLMGKVRRVRLDASQHVTCANCLKGAYTGYYAATTGLSRADTEEIEKVWRLGYGITFRRQRDAPRFALYGGTADGVGEPVHGRHAIVDAVAAVRAVCTRALAWPHDSEERAVARSALARRCRWWGCTGDPLRWLGSREHIAVAAQIERAVDTKDYQKEVFDYYILYEAWLATQARADATEGGGDDTYGYKGTVFLHDDDEYGEALRGGEHSVWETGCSRPILDVEGAVLPYGFINAGVVRVEHMCRQGISGMRIMDYSEAAKAHGLRFNKIDQKLWDVAVRAVYGAVSEADWDTYRKPLSSRQLWDGLRTLHEERAAAHGGRRCVAAGGSRQLTRALVEARRAAAGCDDGDVDWEALMEADYPGVARRGPTEWSCGAPSDADRYTGVRIVCCWKGAGWRGLSDVGEHGGTGLTLPTEAEVHDRVAGLGRWEVGTDGVVRVNGVEATAEHTVAAPVLELFRRSCAELVAIGCVEVRGRSKPAPAGTWVLNAHNTNELLRKGAWAQAKYGITHAAATDGGRQQVPVPGASSGRMRMAAAASAVLHDGRVVSTALDPYGQGLHSYLTEIMALIILLRAVPDGARLLVVIDARSPIQAVVAFRKAHVHKRGEYYLDEVIDVLLQEMERMELIVFLWAKSHVGNAPNEIADHRVTLALMEESAHVRMGRCRHRSMRFAASRSEHKWASQLMRSFVSEWLRGSSVNSVWKRTGDWKLSYKESGISGLDRRALRSAQQRRLLPADPARHRGETAELLQSKQCPCGAGGVCSTMHWWFDCLRDKAVRCRSLLVVAAKDCYKATANGEIKHEHTRNLLRVLQGQTRDGWERELAYRWLCGCIVKPPVHDAGARTAAVKVIGLAAKMASEGGRETRLEGEAAVETVRLNRLARRHARRWRELVALLGPLRGHALVEARGGQGAAVEVGRVRVRGATEDWDRAGREWRALRVLRCWAGRGCRVTAERAGWMQCVEWRVRLCAEKGRGRVVAAIGEAERRREQASRAQAAHFASMMAPAGERGVPYLAAGLVDAEVNFTTPKKRGRSKGQRAAAGGKRRRRGVAADNSDEESGEQEDSDEEGGESDVPEVGERLEVLWTEEDVWFGCVVKRRRIDEDGAWAHQVKYDVPGWPDDWHRLHEEEWRRDYSTEDDRGLRRDEAAYLPEVWTGEIDSEAAAAAAGAKTGPSREERAAARGKRREEAGAGKSDRAAELRSDWAKAVRLLDGLQDHNGEVSKDMFRRECSRVRAGRGVWLRVLEAAEEADTIMIRGSRIHVIGDVGTLIEDDEGEDELMEDDEL